MSPSCETFLLISIFWVLTCLKFNGHYKLQPYLKNPSTFKLNMSTNGWEKDVSDMTFEGKNTATWIKRKGSAPDTCQVPMGALQYFRAWNCLADRTLEYLHQAVTWHISACHIGKEFFFYPPNLASPSFWASIGNWQQWIAMYQQLPDHQELWRQHQ